MLPRFTFGSILTACLFLFAPTLFPDQAGAIPPSKGYVPGEVLVKLKPEASASSKSLTPVSDFPADIRSVCDQKGLLTVRSLVLRPVSAPTVFKANDKAQRASAPSANEGLFLLRFKKGAPLPTLIDDLKTLPQVEYAEPNYIGSLCLAPSDIAYVTNQQALYRDVLGLEDAWNETTGSPDVVVAILDSGIDPFHSEFVDRLLTGKNFVTGGTDTADPLGHGTRVAGIIGGRGNDVGPDSGLAGVCWDCRLMPIVISGTDSLVTSATVVEAIDYAWRNGADVINMSFAIAQESKALEAACNIASQFAVLVAAAGNEGQNLVPTYPAAYAPVIGVAAVDASGERAAFSNYNYPGVNDFLSLAAPGVGIFTTIPGSIYDGLRTNGTSFAAPFVSGVAALVKAKYSDQSPAAIQAHIERHGTPLPGNVSLHGLLDAGAALTNDLVPQLVVDEIEINDDPSFDTDNDGDYALDGDETADLVLTLRNDGGDLSAPVTATLVSNHPNIGVVTGTLDIPALPHGRIFRNTAVPLAIQVAAAAPQANNATLTLDLPGSIPDVTFNTVIEDEAPIPQDVTDDLTLTADQTWIATGVTTVATGATLTVEPGTTVKFEEGATLEIEGALAADGTGAEPIHMQSKAPLGVSPFRVPLGFPVVNSNGLLAVGDVDNDGFRDIVASKTTGPASLFRNDGNGGFLPELPIGGYSINRAVYLADVNADTFLDLLSFNNTDLLVLMGGGTGSFEDPVNFSTGYPDIIDLGVGDVTQDGNIDIFLSHQTPTNRLTLFEGDGGGSFSVHGSSQDLPDSPGPPLVAEMTGDSLLDICDGKMFYKGLGSGTFSAGIPLPRTYGRVATGDLTGDGIPDLFVAAILTVLEGDGSGSFNTLIDLDPIPYHGYNDVAVADVTGDGYPDAIACGDGFLFLYESDGNGSFLPLRVIDAEGVSRLTSADINTDGSVDIITTGTGKVNVFYSPGQRLLNDRLTIAPVGVVGRIALGHVNADSHLDLIVPRVNATIASSYLGDGRGHFSFHQDIPSDLFNACPEVFPTDLTGDSVDELLVAHSCPDQVTVQIADGLGGYSGQIAYPVGDDPRTMAVGDLNGDGDTDFVTANNGSNNVTIYFGNGSGGFVFSEDSPVGISPRWISVADLTGDGTPEIATANWGDDTVSILSVGNTGIIESSATFPVRQAINDMAVGDLSGDGISDVLVASQGGFGLGSAVTMVKGDSAGLFPDTETIEVVHDPNRIECFDLDNDGRDDLALLNTSNNALTILMGTGDGGVGLEVRKAVGRYPVGFSTADVDDNGALDLLVVTSELLDQGQLQDQVQILLNDGVGGLGGYPTIRAGTNSTITLNHVKASVHGPIVTSGTGTISESLFRDTGGSGLSVLGTGSVSACTAVNCVRGFSFGNNSFGAENLLALACEEMGIVANDATACVSLNNGHTGMVLNGSASSCLSSENGVNGIVATGSVLSSLARENLGIGIVASMIANSSAVSNNLFGMTARGTVSESVAIGNAAGIDSPTIENCLILGTFGSALAGANTVNDSVFLENQTISDQDIQFNSTVIADNDDAGNPTAIDGMYIAGNQGGGVDGIPVVNSTIIGNKGPGIANNVSVMGSNVAFNTGAGVVGGTVAGSFVMGNLGGNLTGGASGSTVADPVDGAPAFLASVTLSRAEPVGIGPLEATFEFSKDMDTSIPLWVTFGIEAPYTSFVMDKNPGWLNPRAWKASFPVGGEVGTGIHTLRVSGAKPVAESRTIPPDTYHRFEVDIDGGLALSNGRVIARTPTSLTIAWNPSVDVEIVGVSILRSLQASGPYQNLGTVSFPATEFFDAGLETGLPYFYKIYEHDASLNHRELVQPFSGTTGSPYTPTPTATGTETPVPTSTPTPTPTLVPEVWVDFAYAGVETGIQSQPYNTFSEGISQVQPGGTVKFKPGTSAESLRVTKSMHLAAPLGGPVRLGVGGGSSMLTVEVGNPYDLFPNPFPDGEVDVRDLLIHIENMKADKVHRSTLLGFALQWTK